MSQALSLIKNLRLPRAKGIIHVGANIGQERASYRNAKPDICVYIEPIPAVYEQLANNLREIPNHYPVQALCSNLDNEEITFNIASNSGESSSIFGLGKHEQLYPQINYVESLKIRSKTLDSLIEEKFPEKNFNVLVINTKGAELKVLKGSHKLLENSISCIYVEVSEDPLYEGGCTFEEVAEFLKPYGFKQKYMGLNHMNWGNAFFAKNVIKSIPSPPGENLALNKPAQQSSLSKWSQPSDAQGAVNGIKTGGFNFHTDKDINPWWQVDLQDVYRLSEVRVYNRVDSGCDRVSNLQVSVSQDGYNWQQVYFNESNSIFGGIDGDPLIVPIDCQIGRYIRLQLNEENYFHLDEVEAYGQKVSTSGNSTESTRSPGLYNFFKRW
jgi:FkbM family methyltransferase